ncbi:MAG TPA: phosphatase PAP2 family protein [Fimbriimonadaceae bacterium]|nr:phosphatase PAP2 family protein [Fimbriimonadaceae bacterium]
MSLTLRYSAVLAVMAAAAAGSAQVQTWHNVGEIGGPVLVVAGLAAPFIQDGDRAGSHAARTFDGLLVSGAAAEFLKVTTRERRPYGTTLDSFPSEHATASFAVAAAQSYYHPKQAPFWYGAATIVAVARVAGHDHFVQDVIAGAALGTGAGYLSVTSKHGWLIAPIVEKGRAGVLLTLNSRF